MARPSRKDTAATIIVRPFRQRCQAPRFSRQERRMRSGTLAPPSSSTCYRARRNHQTCPPGRSGATSRGSTSPAASGCRTRAMGALGGGRKKTADKAWPRQGWGQGLARASGGDKTRLFVLYCQANCWMSWNAAKRALSFGYSNVAWYPDGTDGWQAADLPLAESQPEPRPGETLPPSH